MITVKSKKGEGTEFTVTLTLDDADNSSDKRNFEIDPGEMKILVIDDDPIACEHAKLVLEKAGIASETVTSGKEAVELVKLRQARQDPYNLILVDWQMPDIDGIETTKKIKEIVGNETAVIILTAYKWDDIFDEAVKAGVDSFLAKPLFASNVIEEFKSALAKKRGLDEDEPDPSELKGKRVLLAEDVQINAEIMMMVLSSQEINVDLAENGKIAVELFKSHDEGYYDAILMDMRMPEMDGLEATKTIRAMGKKDSEDIPIIALTANAFDEDVQRSLQAGLNAHLSKPVQPEALYKTLAKYIRKRG